MARPRLSDRADYGLVYLTPIVAFHKGRITLDQLGEVVHGYGEALEAYRAGNFDPSAIDIPAVFAMDSEAWQKHLECFIDGIDKTERARAKKRGECVSLSVSPSITDNRSKDENKGEINEDEKKGREGEKGREREGGGMPPRAFAEQLRLLRERDGKAYDPVSLAVMACGTQSDDDRRAFGVALSRIGKTAFLVALEECHRRAGLKPIPPAIFQKELNSVEGRDHAGVS